MAIPKIKVGKCSVEGCEKLAATLRLCNGHYLRQRRYGDVLAGGPTPTEKGAKKLFLDSLSLVGEGCLFWPFPWSGSYYPVAFWTKSGNVLAHRYSCERAHGPCPSGLEAAHSCGNGHLGCVAPWHLSWKTHAENLMDRRTHGTFPMGDTHGMAVLTEEQARFIKFSSEKTSILSKKFGITYETVQNIRASRNWKHLDGDRS